MCEMILLVFITGLRCGTSDVLRARKPLGLVELLRGMTQKGIVSAKLMSTRENNQADEFLFYVLSIYLYI